MSDTPLLVTTERREDGVAVVRLDNGKVNALSTELLRQLASAAESLTDDPPGAVIVSVAFLTFCLTTSRAITLSAERP